MSNTYLGGSHSYSVFRVVCSGGVVFCSAITTFSKKKLGGTIAVLSVNIFLYRSNDLLLAHVSIAMLFTTCMFSVPLRISMAKPSLTWIYLER